MTSSCLEKIFRTMKLYALLMTLKISHLITIYAKLDTYPVAILARNFRKS